MEKNDYKKIVASCFCSMMLVSSAWAQESDLYAGGTGSKSDPYLIETEAQFDAVRENRGSYFKLMADLDFASYEKEGGWWPVGAEMVRTNVLAVRLMVMGIRFPI